MGDSKNEPAGEGLPDGWSKEYRPRKARPGARARRDLFYIDPTNSYEFRSLKDVYRHLESRDTSNSAVTPNKRKVQDLQISGNQSHHAEGPSDNIKMDTAHESNPENRENSENMPSSELDGVSQRRLTELELQKARVNNQSVKHESAGREEANVEPKPKEKKQKTKPVKQISTPLRASARLTALKLNQEASDAARDSPVSTSADTADQLQPTKQVKNPKSRTTASLYPQKKDGSYSASASGHAKDKYPSVSEQTLGTSVGCSITKAGYQNAPPEVHVPPQQAGVFETADAMPGSSLSSLLRSIWSDPCLEFAFKTLTGDIPVANCFLQNSNKGPVPNSSTSIYDGTRMRHAQVDRVRMPMPRPSDKLYSSGWFPPQ